MAQKKKISLDAVETWRRERMPFLAAAQNKESFFKRIAEFLPSLDPRYQAIEKAHDIVEEAFDDVKRDSGERYITHLRAVSLIILEYLEVRDYETLIAALLHDLVETKPDEWPIERVRNEFSTSIALLLQYLSQPHDGEFGSKEDAERVYHARFEFAPREFFIIKLPDRLHNLLTLGARPREKQIAKIEETERYYLRYARKHLILLPELREVLMLLRAKTS